MGMGEEKNSLMPNYGWVQNTSNLSTVRDTIELLPEHGMKHSELMEAIKDFRLRNDHLPSRWTWDARCRIKAIYACGLVKLDRNIQGYVLTDIGRKLKSCPKSKEYFRDIRILSTQERNVFRKGLLTNPPVIRVLELLFQERRTTNSGLSKYDIGAQLGFVGDTGFTHYEPDWIVANGYSFTDKEGDADKWARTILRWLTQVNWVEKSEVSQDVLGKSLGLYKALPVVERVLRYDVKSINRVVPSEMLCSNHHQFPKLVQKRRVVLLHELNTSTVTIKQVVDKLLEKDIVVDEETIKFEIISLRQAGFRIAKEGLYFKLEDKLELDINPKLFTSTNEEETTIDKIIAKMVVQYESTIPARLVDNLIRYGYDGSFGNDFEAAVAQYFKFLGYETSYLGQGKGRVTDVIARYKDSKYAKSYGIIIDAKATSTKYSFPAGDVRKMKEYIDKHGKELMKEYIPQHSFAFVSSEFITNVSKPLTEIYDGTNVQGTAMGVMELLELGSYIKEGKASIEGLYGSYTTNELFEL